MSGLTAKAERVLSVASGLELAGYRREHVRERVRRAVEREELADAGKLAGLLAADEAARARFRRSVAISVSGLFRDPHQFELLERDLLPRLLSDGRSIRVWSAGCSDGAELYSVALTLKRLGALGRSHLLGSDVLDENVLAARRGVYGEREIPAEVRARARFERRDLLRDGAPQGAWSVVLCRNVAIYFSREARASLHELLVGALAPGGILMLGRSERVSQPRELGVEPVGPHAYRKAA